MEIKRRDFGKLEDGREIDLFTLINDNKMKVSITNYGGIISEIIVEDKDGNFDDVTLGFDKVDDYVKDSPYFGAIIGRYGNRIANSKFVLDGKEYKLMNNDGENHLHGGGVGFNKILWEVETFEEADEVGLVLTYLSKDGEEGYPGNLSVEVIYSLNNNNEIGMNYKATTDKPTVCNLTNHAYFNLKDGGNSLITDHKIKINSNEFTEINDSAITTGEILSVDNTPFDLREITKIESVIDADDQQINNGIGFDHTFVVDGKNGELRKAAEVTEETTGRVFQVFTTEPGVQFYTGNHLNGSLVGKGDVKYEKRHGFCLETQHYPDSPNKPNFPTTELRPGEIYNSSTIYKFSLLE